MKESGLYLFKRAQGFVENGGRKEYGRNQKIYLCEDVDLSASKELLKYQLILGISNRVAHI